MGTQKPSEPPVRRKAAPRRGCSVPAFVLLGVAVALASLIGRGIAAVLSG